MSQTPRIGITLGDPGGIGPEVVLKSLTQNQDTVFNPIIFGSKSILTHPKLKPLADQLPAHVISEFQDIYPLNSFDIGCPSPANGAASLAYIKAAHEAASRHQIDAMVTAPISKTSICLANCEETGHTTLLQKLTNSPHVSMAFYTPTLKVVLATIHHPLRQVPELINEECIKTAINNSFLFAQSLRFANPKIAVCGLNPHAGEDGLFGT
ncbi:MAG: 4-hydroxythreonine-4-phosphate dehydrogenase PdxA, partial [Candidatus Margulisbacteria bacterium]|nr:4-hydroxythreonine-4-phosphate dehydrogenase PdxA [Candidatus Margulisiibacteriota bacterium]